MFGQILDTANYAFSWYAVPVGLTGIMMLGRGVLVVVRERGSRVSLTFGLLTLSAALWLLGFAAIYSARIEPVARWWSQAAQFGVVLIPSAIIMFTLSILRQFRQKRVWVWTGLALSILFFASISLTGLFVTGVRRYFWGYYPAYGLLSIPFVVFFFVAVVASLYLFWIGYQLAPPGSVRQQRLKALSLAFAVAYLGAADFLPAYGVPLYPFGYVPVFAFIVLSARAIRRYHLVDITPAIAVDHVLAIMADALVVLDLDGVLRVVNPAACTLFGRTEAELVGMPIASIDDRFLPPERAETLIRSAEIVSYEIIVTTATRETRIFSVSASLMRSDGNEPLAIVCIARDITQSKRAEEEIRKLNADLELRVVERTRQLEGAISELEAFSYSVSHDLRAPLRSIVSFSQILLSDYSDRLDLDGRDALERVHTAGQRMNHLIDALLMLSRVTRNELDREVVDLSALARSIVDELRERDPERRVEVAIQAHLVVQGDRELLRVAMQNLLDNAWKFTATRNCTQIEVGAYRDGVRQVYFVRDNGVGFDMAYVDRLFVPFQRLHASTEFPGTGVGLATVQRVVHRHGGRVWAESVPGEGATFYFTL